MKRFIIFIISGILFWGCEDYFDTDPQGAIPEEKFYQNINDFQLALTSAYSVLKEEDYQKCLVLLGDARSDDFAYGYSSNPDEFLEDGFKLVRYNITPENYWVNYWYYLNYQGVFRANQLLKHIEDSVKLFSTANSDGDIWQWQHIYGQGLFLRAYYYFNLIKTYGGVPIVPVNIGRDSLKTPRASLEKNYKYIEKDLRTAALLLKSDIKNNTDHIGEVSKWAALALLMKTYIYQAKPGENTDKWRAALEIGNVLFKGESITYNDLLKPSEFYPDQTWEDLWSKFKFDLRLNMPVPQGNDAVLNFGLVNLQSLYDWPKLWRVEYQNSQNNSAIIFSIPCMISSVLNPSDYSLSNYLDRLYGVRYEYACYPVFPTESLNKAFNLEKGDPRRFYGMYSHGGEVLAEDLKEIRIGGVATENFLVFIKRWLVPGSESISDNTATARNIILMRYTDYLLFYAEALNEMGMGNESIDILNQIRKNLFDSMGKGSGDFNTSFNYGPYETVRDRIWHERRMELAGEHDRYFDLVRQGRAADIMNGSEGVIDQLAIAKQGIKFIKGVHERLPIPLKEIELSNGIIFQNPGY